MPQINFDLGEQDKKVVEFSEKWKLSKPDTIKKIIKLFREEENGNTG